MSQRPQTTLPVVPSTTLLRERPEAAVIVNPISLVEPILPSAPNAATAFAEAQIPVGLPTSVTDFDAALLVSSEIALATGLGQNGNRGMYGRSSNVQQTAATVAASYTTALGETLGRLNDAARSADLVNAKFSTEGYTVAVKKFVAEIDGAVDKYEANAEAYTQAMNIIYDADVTAAKLKTLGEEKAIGLETDFEVDYRKTQSQNFIALNRSDRAIASRELDRLNQIEINETKQINTHGYTKYEHEWNTKSKSYEMSTSSDAELFVASDLSDSRIKAATSAALERKMGSQKVTDARNAALTDTTRERISQIALKNPVLRDTAASELAATLQVYGDKAAASLVNNKAELQAELAKELTVLQGSKEGKVIEFAATADTYLWKNQAHVAAINATATSRERLADSRIKSVSDGYGKITTAKEFTNEKEFEAQEAAIKVNSGYYKDVLDINKGYLDTILEKKLGNATTMNSDLLAAEKETSAQDNKARIDTLGITSAAEIKANSDRAKASSAALRGRHEATTAAADAMRDASINMVNIKVGANKQSLEAKYASEEQNTILGYDTKYAVEVLLDNARLAAIEAQKTLDLDSLRALNDARLAAQTTYIDAELAIKSEERTAQIAAQTVNLEAASYSATQHTAAQAYVVGQSMRMQAYTAVLSAATDANSRILGIMATHNNTMRSEVTGYYIASASQNQRRDVYAYDDSKK